MGLGQQSNDPSKQDYYFLNIMPGLNNDRIHNLENSRLKGLLSFRQFSVGTGFPPFWILLRYISTSRYTPLLEIAIGHFSPV